MTHPLPSMDLAPDIQGNTHIVISPHLDDGIFSCGGSIHRLLMGGEGVVILTAMAGEPSPGPLSPLAKTLHRSWGNESPSAILRARRSEDIAAARALGAEIIHWSIPDALYRQDATSKGPLYPNFRSLFGEPHPQDRALIDALTDTFERLPRAASIRAPLGIGGHVDHQIINRAARRALGPTCLFYEDYPYLQRDPPALDPFISAGWTPQAQALGSDDIDARLQGMEAYKSQLPNFWRDGGELREALRSFVRARGGEVLWSPPEDGA